MRRCAGGIILKDQQILLGKRSPDLEFYPNVWDIIGGHCEPDETPEETLIRELKEEIGITPRLFVKCAVLSEPHSECYGEGEYHVYIVMEWTGSEPTMLNNEHSEVRWFIFKEAAGLELAHPEYAELFRTVQQWIRGCKSQDLHPTGS
jgi:mutator protein MutT